jgi:uncharacterized protein YbjQ (UPF0145 family)
VDMTDGELLWAHKCGFEPLGVVLGNSVYHIGLQVKRWSQNQELEVLTQAMQNASDLAISRMLAEAQQLGADGVLVVAFTVERNVEMTNYAQAVYDARELAMARMHAEGDRLGASGIAGVGQSVEFHGWGDHVMEYYAAGDAVVAISDTHDFPDPTPVFSYT